MKIHSTNQRVLVCPNDMRDGEIGIIRKWNEQGSVGIIVQKYGERCLVALGKAEEMSYTSAGSLTGDYLQIEILPKGTLLEI